MTSAFLGTTLPPKVEGKERSRNYQLLLENGETPMGYYYYGQPCINNVGAGWTVCPYNHKVPAEVVGYTGLTPFLAKLYPYPL